jgi:hypothetical protein
MSPLCPRRCEQRAKPSNATAPFWPASPAATRQIPLADMEAVTVRAVLTHCYGGRVGPTALPALAAKLLKAGLEKTRVKKKPQPRGFFSGFLFFLVVFWFFVFCGFFGFFVFFLFFGFFYTFAQKREFFGFLQFQEYF